MPQQPPPAEHTQRVIDSTMEQDRQRATKTTTNYIKTEFLRGGHQTAIIEIIYKVYESDYPMIGEETTTHAVGVASGL